MKKITLIPNLPFSSVSLTARQYDDSKRARKSRAYSPAHLQENILAPLAWRSTKMGICALMFFWTESDEPCESSFQKFSTS